MKDSLIEMIMSLTKLDNFPNVSITLVVDGFLISGEIIHSDEYFAHGPLMPLIKEAIDKVIEKEGQPDKADVKFIHLKNAKYCTPGSQPVPNNEDMYCRIRIDKVSAFNMGGLGVE